jgi:hypothetical protein
MPSTIEVFIFIELKKRGRIPGLQFHVGGGCEASQASTHKSVVVG